MSDPREAPPSDMVLIDEPATVRVPIVDLTRGAGGPRDRQLLFGDEVTVLNRMENYCFIRSRKDGYCGTITANSVTALTPATHLVTARATHAYLAPDLKSSDRACLSFGSSLTALSETATFIETALGFVPRQHVRPVDAHATDPVSIASLFLGTPYLWGGNSALGIDCSGLVQAACLACGLPCPGDSDQQEARLGGILPDGSDLKRNDLIFWKGHVALVCDPKTIIHANAGHMSVTFENISDALSRIEMQGDGRPTSYKRLPPVS